MELEEGIFSGFESLSKGDESKELAVLIESKY